MTSCNITLTGKKPQNPAYPKELRTIGDHIRKIRLDRGMLQKEIAESLDVSEETIVNWENSHRNPMIHHMPKIIEFLGYQPREEQDLAALGHELLAYRKTKGLTQKQLADIIGIDDKSLSKIERNPTRCFRRTLDRVLTFKNKYILKINAIN